MEVLSILLNLFAVMFWLFRGFLTLMATLENPVSGFTIPIMEAEILLLFVTLFCIVMIFRRNIIFASIYFGTYFMYFGYGISNAIITDNLADAFIMGLGLLIAGLNFMDVMLNKNRKGSTKNNKTDWFYGTDKYERELDERADKNQYKF